jgi:hypothetical protein
VIAQVNDNPPTREQMAAYIAACAVLPATDRNFEMHAITWTQLFPRHTEQGVSAQFRVEALARLVNQSPLPGWTEPQSDGGLLTREVIFAAAAAEPVIEKGGELTFDRESLLKRAFQLAKRDQ